MAADAAPEAGPTVAADSLRFDEPFEGIAGAAQPGPERPPPVAAGSREAEIATADSAIPPPEPPRSEEHTSELQSLMRISYAVFCLKKKYDVYEIVITSVFPHFYKYPKAYSIFV